MDKTLFLVDLSLQTMSKLKALAEQAEGTEVSVCQGQIGDLSVNTNLTDEQVETVKQYLKFEFISFKDIRKQFLEFEHKYIVAGNDVFTKTLVEELNLMGRKDVGVLNFGPDRTPEQALELAQTSLQMCRQVVATMSDLKLQFTALIETLTEEQRAKYNEILSKTKANVQQTLKIQKDFIIYLSQLKGHKKMETIISEYCEENKLPDLTVSVIQNYEKISGLSEEDFKKTLEAEFNGTDLVRNESFLHAFLMTYTSVTVSSDSKQ